MNKFIALGCFFAALGVAAGAFGAHGLKNILSPDMLAVYETAVRYQMYHSFGLIAVGVLAKLHGEASRTVIAGWCFVAGILLFSGSLYALTLADMKWLGAVTPLGGVAFIAGWLSLAFSLSQTNR
jgi:uncharacterized membrane protein YgdD (TMEM256/DUF423 family)